MSVRASSWVWEHSAARGAARLVLLALADYAGADDGDAWPALATVARRCGIDQRTARRAIRELEEAGELEVDVMGGPHGTNRYRLTFTAALPAAVDNPVDDPPGQDAPPRTIPTVTPDRMPPEPLENHQNENPPTPTGSADGAPGGKLTPRQAGTNPRAQRAAADDPHTARQAAARLLADRSAARARGDLCPPCAGDGWTPVADDATATVLERCPTCSGTGVRLDP